VYVYATGMPVSRWIFRDNNTGGWNTYNTTSDNISYYMSASTPTVRSFRFVVSTPTCNDTSMAVDVNIVPAGYGNNPSIKLSSSNYNACGGGNITLRIMNPAAQVTQWLYRDNGGKWSSLSYTSSQSYSTSLSSVSSQTVRDFCVIVQNPNSCRQDTSDFTSVTINPSLAGNNINIKPTLNSSTICAGTTGIATVEWPLQIGNWIYQDNGTGPWQSFTSSSTTAYDYNTTVTNTTIRAYKVILLNPATCAADTSDAVYLTINPAGRRNLTDLIPRLTGTSNTICAGNYQYYQFSSSGSYQWYYRDSSNGTWTSAGSGTSISIYANTNITKPITREVRAVLNNSSAFCSYDTSASVFYNIKPTTYGNTTTAIPYTTQKDYCTGSQITVYMNNGMSVSGWYTRNNNTGPWSYVSSGTTYYDYSTSVTSNTLRSYKAVISNTTLCRVDTTPEIQVNIKIATAGGNVAIQPITEQKAYCAGAYIYGSVPSNNNMAVVKWIYRDNKTGSWVDLPFQTSNSFSDNYTSTITTSTVRSYRALVRNYETFKIDTTLEVSVQINPLSRGNFNSAPTSPQNLICNQNSVTLNMVTPGGYTVNSWIYRELPNQGWTNYGSTSTSISDYVSTTNPSKTYRVILFNSGLCKYDTTNALTLQVNQRTGRYNNAILPNSSVQSVCNGTSFNLSISSTSGTSVAKWQYNDNNSTWKDINSTSTSYTESANNARVLIPTNRSYRVVIYDNNGCTVDTSAGRNVTITPYIGGVVSSYTPVTSNPVICSGNSYAVYINNYSGSVQKWIYRENGGSWTEFNSSTSSSYLYDYNYYVNNVTNREYKAMLIRTGTCFIDTTQTLSVQLRPYSYGNANAVTPTTSTPAICSGNSLSVNLSNFSGTVHKWIYKESTGSEWKELINSSGSSSYSESNQLALFNTIKQFRAILLTTGCSFDTTSSVSVQLTARTYGNAPNVAVTSSAGIYCSASTIQVTINGSLPSGGSVRKWMYMDNQNNVWIDIPSSTGTSYSHTNTAVNVSTTRSYRLIVNNTNSCSYDSSGIYSVTINPASRGVISVTPSISPSSICNASSTPYFSVSSYNGTILKWIYNSDNTGWKDFQYTTTSAGAYDYNNVVMAPTNRQYRAIISNPATCSIDTTNSVSSFLSPYIYGNLSTALPTGPRTVSCYTKSVTSTLNPAPSGYSISKWIYSNNNGEWNDFTSSTSSTTLTDNNTWVAIPTGRTYRVILTNNTLCKIDTSGSFSVLINPRSSNIGNRNLQPTSNKTLVCSGSTVTVSTSPGTGNEIYRWTYSDNGANGPWYDAYNSYNTTNYTHSSTYITSDVTRLYRAIITDTSTCDFDSTLAVAVTLKAMTYGKDTSLTISSLDTICAGTTLNLSVSPGSGNSVVKWLYNLNAGPWQEFTSSTASTSLSDNNTLFAPGTTKGYTNIILKGATCSNDTLTKVKSVYIKNKTFGSSTTSASVTSTDTVCTGNNVSMFCSGTIERWLYSDGNTNNWQVISNSATSSYSHTNTGVSNSVWRYYRAIINTGSCNADSSKYDSVYLRVYTGGNIAVTPTTANTTICYGNSLNISVSITNATIQRWIYRDNAGVWNTLSTTTSSSVSDNNTYLNIPTTREYKVIVLKNCSYDTTNALTVSIVPKTAGTDLTKVPTASSTSVCTSNPVSNISVTPGSGNSIVQWLYRDNGGVWNILVTGNQNGVYDYNTYTGVQVIRDYVAIINNNTTCRFDTTAKLTVTINPIVLGNSSRTPVVPAISCMGSSYTVSMNVASDSSIIRFFYNTGNGWTDRGYISPTTSYSFSDYAYNSATPYTVGYRAVIYKAGNCHIDTTAAAYVNIGQRVYGNDNAITPSAASTVCSNTSFTVSVSAGSGNSVQNWIYSDNNGPWVPIYTSSTAFSNSLSPVNSIVRKYRALIIKGSVCSIDTTAASTTTISPYIYGLDTVAKTTVSAPKGICTGNTVTVSTSGVSGTINTWLYRNDYTGNWINLYQSGSSISDFNTNVSSSINRQYALVIYKSATCRLDTTTKNDTAFISPRTLGTDTTFKPTTPLTSVCTGSAVPLSISPGSNTIVQWLYRDNGGNWNVLQNTSSTSLNDYNTVVSSTVIRNYRAIIRKANVCALDSSGLLTITINTRTNATDNTIVPTVNNANICSGNIVNVSVAPGTGNSVIKWMYNNAGSGWTDWVTTSATSLSDYNTTTSVTVNRQYKAIISKASGCSIDSSASVSVNINPLGYGNQNTVVPITSKTSVCSGTPISLGLSGYTIKHWLSRENNGAWNIINTTSSSYTDFSTGTSTLISRQYAAVIVNASGCSFDTTGVTTVLINPITSSTLTTAAQASQSSVCNGSPINVFINTPSGYSINQWLFRNVGGDWSPLNAGNSASVTDFNTTITSNITREYKVLLNNLTGCSIDSSTAVSVSINMISQGSNLSVVPFASQSTICSGATAILNITGFSGTVIQWLYRDSAIYGWSQTGSSGLTLFHNSTFVSYTRVREYRAILYNPANCSYDTSAATQITINPQLQGNANAVVPTTSAPSFCSGATISLNASGFINGGVVKGWLFNNNGGAWTPIPGSASPSITHNNTTVSVLTNRSYRALVLTGCVTDTTAALNITIDVYPAKPTVQRSGLSDTLTSSVTGTTYQWRLNGNIVSGGTSQTLIATQNGNYTVEVGNASGCKTSSDAFNFVRSAIEEEWLKNNINVYPNPTSDGLVYIEIPNLSVRSLDAVVTDIYGRNVMKKHFEGHTAPMTLNLDEMKSGVYLITFSTENVSVTKRIVLNR